MLVDFQNDFCSPDLVSDRPPTNTHNAEAAERANLFAGRAAELGAHVVYTRQILDYPRLTPRQRRWEQNGLCPAGSWRADLFIEPVPGSTVITKYRFDSWQSQSFVDYLEERDIDGLVICGVELICCVMYAVLGAKERGYHYVVPQDLVSGQDPGDATDNKAARDLLRYSQPQHVVDSSDDILQRWTRRA